MSQFHSSSYAGVRALVLGASGFIGRWVARLLCSQGADVYLAVLDRAEAEPIFHRYAIKGRVYEADLRDEAQLQGIIQAIRPSITFNLIGYGVVPSERDDEVAAYAINADLVKNLCHVVAEFRDKDWTGQDLIHVGTALEYGSLDGDLSETSIPEPTELYGQSKLAGTLELEKCSETHGLKALTARLFTIYGPGEQDGRLLPSLWRLAHTNRSLAMTRDKAVTANFKILDHQCYLHMTLTKKRGSVCFDAASSLSEKQGLTGQG